MITINMACAAPKSLKQVVSFLQVSDRKFSVKDKKEHNSFIRSTTWNLKYKYLAKKEKGLVIQHISKLFNFSIIQSKQLLIKAIRGELKNPKSTKNSKGFKMKYPTADIELLTQV